MTLQPNTQITPETVGMLKAGDWLRYGDDQLCQFQHGQDDVRVCVTFGPSMDEYLAVPIEFLTYIGPDLGDGWIGWSGGENPVPGMRVNIRQRGNTLRGSGIWESDRQDWSHDPDPGDAQDITAFRPAVEARE